MLKRWWQRPTPTPEPLDQDYDDDLLRYPPAAKGVPVLAPKRLLCDQSDMIAKLREAMPFSFDEFEKWIAPFLLSIAEWVHLLPASQDHHHRLVGGLLRHSLEVGWMSTRLSNDRVFEPTAEPSIRRCREPRWHVAAGLCGLSHDLGKIFADMEVTNNGGDLVWNPVLESLVAWATNAGITRYYVRYRPQRTKDGHEAMAQFMFNRLAPVSLVAWLWEGGPDILEVMTRALTQGTSDRNELRRFMIAADRHSVDLDVRQSGLLLQAPGMGLPIHTYLLTAMAALIQDGVWKVNRPGARVWVLLLPNNEQRVFLAWSSACEELLKRVDEEHMPGVPRRPARLIKLLLEAEVAEPYTDPDGEIHDLWPVAPPGIGTDRRIVLLCACIKATDLVFRNRAKPDAISGGEIIPPGTTAAPLPADDSLSSAKGEDDQAGGVPKGEETAAREVVNIPEVVEVVQNQRSSMSTSEPGRFAEPDDDGHADKPEQLLRNCEAQKMVAHGGFQGDDLMRRPAATRLPRSALPRHLALWMN